MKQNIFMLYKPTIFLILYQIFWWVISSRSCGLDLYYIYLSFAAIVYYASIKELAMSIYIQVVYVRVMAVTLTFFVGACKLSKYQILKCPF